MSESWNLEVTEDVGGAFAHLLAAGLTSGSTLFVSGGATGPRMLHEASETVAVRTLLPSITIAQVDERVVDPTSQSSNAYWLEREVLVPLANEGVAPAALELLFGPLTYHSLASEIAEYISETPGTEEFNGVQKLLASHVAEVEARVESQIDTAIIHLGIGTDGHIASLFPNSRALLPTDRLVAVNLDISGRNPYFRLTLTMEALRRARIIVLTTVGESKAKAMRKLLRDENAPTDGLPRDRTTILCNPAALVSTTRT